MSSEQSNLPTLAEVEAAAASGRLAALVTSLAAQARPGDPHDAAAWLARALRVDLATLCADPALAFQSVWNRGYWLGAAEGVPFRPARMYTGPAVLQPLLRRWQRDRPARPWARALRPPRYPLEGALREEYRGALARASSVGFASGGRVLRAGELAWDRATGARVVPAPAFDAPARPDWLFAHHAPGGGGGSHWGRCHLLERTTGRTVLDVRVNDDDSYGTFAASDDGATVFVGGWFADDGGVVCRLDRAARAAVWRVELDRDVHALATTPDGFLVAAFGDRGATLLDGRNGRSLAQLDLDAHALAFDRTGRWLASLSGAAARVWDVAALSEDNAWHAPTGARGGWIDAAFSPDGARLLTGTALCDARDGRLIARLELDGPGYLEGGPPDDARRLCDDRFVEATPFHGVRAWETATGRLTVQNAQRRFGLGHDALRFAPDGMHYAHARQSGWHTPLRGLALARVDDGSVTATIPGDDALRFAFAPAGALLATGHADGAVRLWRVPDGALVRACERRAGGARAVNDLCFGLDGARVAAGTLDASLALWDTRTGALLAERPLGDDDENVVTTTNGVQTRVWCATARAVARLHGWHGFVARAHRRALAFREGFAVITHERGAHPPVSIATDGELVLEPRAGLRAAARHEHYALELIAADR